MIDSVYRDGAVFAPVPQKFEAGTVNAAGAVGLAAAIRYLQEKGFDTYDANLELGFAPDERDYQIAADILSFLNIKQIKLLTNNPDKLEQLEKSGIEVVERLPLQIPAHVENRTYLQTKQEKFHHLLHIV